MTSSPDAVVALTLTSVGVVIVGGVELYSSAPIEHAFARFAPRWSSLVHVASSPAPIAGLPFFSELMSVVPPSLANGASSGSVLLSAPTLQLPLESRL